MDKDQYQHLWELAEDTIVAKDAEIAALREALKPFARYADALDKAGVPATARVAYSPSKVANFVEPVVEDFRIARAALEMSGGVL